MMKYFYFLLISLIFSCSISKKTSIKKAMENKKIDWQGHRGARGLLPENTIPSFLKALEYPITTLELDVAVSKDNQVIVSHEPWMSSHICSHPDGRIVEETADKINLYELTYEEIKKYDCGSRGNERFEEQKAMKTTKPSLKDMVMAVEKYCKENNRSLPNYNIEIKTSPELYDIFTPRPEKFVTLLLEEIEELNIGQRCNLQSFDIVTLETIRKVNKKMPIAYLVEKGEFEKNLEKLSFQPEIYSPYHILVTQETIKKAKTKGMKVIPWTVNKKERAKKLIEIGVDGIITDYPNFSSTVL